MSVKALRVLVGGRGGMTFIDAKIEPMADGFRFGFKLLLL
jgi:hypothetical protein